MANLKLHELIDHLILRIADNFGTEIASAYFGDVGIYPPSAFQLPSGEQGAVVVFDPKYNRLVEGSRVAAQEDRLLGIDVVVMVNLTPYFMALPQEKPAERKLVELTTAIATFLTKHSLVDLDQRVRYSEVGDIDWTWSQRGELAVRAAAIAYEARVTVPRL